MAGVNRQSPQLERLGRHGLHIPLRQRDLVQQPMRAAAPLPRGRTRGSKRKGASRETVERNDVCAGCATASSFYGGRLFARARAAPLATGRVRGLIGRVRDRNPNGRRRAPFRARLRA
jgi:hypothetical protein